MTVGSVIQRVLSEAPSVRTVLAERFGDQAEHPMATLGLIVARPASEGRVGEAAWVLYESGDIVLRRSRAIADIEQALVAHLLLLEHATTGSWLALRQRTLLLSDGSAVLADPGGLHELAGLDRRFATRGVTVLPSTIASVDIATCEVVLPPGVGDLGIAPGRRPIRAIWPRALPPGSGDLAADELALARTLVRYDGLDLETALQDVLALFDRCAVTPRSADGVLDAARGLLAADGAPTS